MDDYISTYLPYIASTPLLSNSRCALPAKVIQFSSGDEIELCFESEIEGLFGNEDEIPDLVNLFGGGPERRVILAPQSLLDQDEENALQNILDLADDNEFDYEYGEGDESSSSPPDSELTKTTSGAEWITAKIKEVKKDCNEFEEILLEAVLKPDDIDVTFDDVHVEPSVIRALRGLTTLSTVAPQAFTYGVLAKETTLGVLLHGPPGTGKTMLAKAVAKEAHAVFLPVSGADFLSRWVGEDEKLVRAVFSLARRLDPCVVFVDEADAVFRTRDADDQDWKRDVASQFLQEWDGVRGGCGRRGFVLAATNRIDDIDAAFLRRLPRRIFVGVPSLAQREGILRSHLRDETLDPDMDLAELAKLTAAYTGSDLKSLCVAAAMAAVYEDVYGDGENGGDSSKTGDKAANPGRKPKKKQRRILRLRHFEQAIREVGTGQGTTSGVTDSTKPRTVPKKAHQGIDAPSLAKFKTFGQMFANGIDD